MDKSFENRIIPESEFMVNSDGSAFHLHLRPEELADDVILVGDPGRVDMVSSFFSTVELRRSSREFVSATGTYSGRRFTVLSTGIGTDNIDIVMNELDALANIDFGTRRVKPQKKSLRILRIGTSGAVRKEIPLGAMVFSEMSAGLDGLLGWYAGRETVSDRDMEEAFLRHTGWRSELPVPYFVKADETLAGLFSGSAVMGITMSAPGFYAPQGRVLRLPLSMPDMLERLESFEYKGRYFTNFEMESSAIAGLGRLMGHRAGTVCTIIANRYLKSSNTDYKASVEATVAKSLDLLASCQSCGE